ncbi:MAG: hypothetical protein EOP83_23300 [Verrucomicrobiaceae bacterium]|nr:MAG: hypothetical protein EOP83_23300 [Verrucomicrobiaceae bacterium]
MKTNLAYIGSAALAVLDRPPETKVIRHVAGFPIETTPKTNPDWERAKKSYAEEAKELRGHLSVRGVEPLAVMPKLWWDRLIEESGLWALAPNDLGQININPREVVEKADGPRAFFAWIIMVGVIIGGTVWATTIPDYANWGMAPVLMFAAAVITGAFTALFSVTFEDTFKALKARWVSALYVAIHGNQKTMGRMITKDSYSAEKIKIALPVPPQDVAETLGKIAMMSNIKVAAEPGAVSFAKSAREVMRQYMADQWKQEKEVRERMRALDPIIYVENGSAVALIAQFGDFPMEQALIDRVLATQTTIR